MTVAALPPEKITNHPDIFISYRRREASYQAAWLHDALSNRFGTNSVFLDIDCIQPGVDYLDEIDETLRRCSVFILVVGQNWLQDPSGQRMIDERDDPVRWEIELALQRGINVIPVLLDGAVMPDASRLPPSIRRIARINATSLRRDGATADMRSLLDAVARIRGTRSDDADREPPEPIKDSAPSSTPPTHRDVHVNDGRLRDQRFRLLCQLAQLFEERVEQSSGAGADPRLPLELALRPALTYRARDRFLGIPASGGQVLPAGTDLLDVFDRSRGLLGDGLLVTGGPGAGKTSLLFEMAAGLTARAREDAEHPIPVYLALQSWSGHRAAFAEWAIAEMNKLFLMPTDLARLWIEDGQIMFLLDGLDEITSPAARRQCTEEINRFCRFGRQVRVPTIVASRAAEYDGARIPLHLETAVEVLALNPAKTLEYLARTDGPARALAGAVHACPGLLDLLGSPLLVAMLGLILVPGSAELPAPRPRDPADLVAAYLDCRLALERQQNRHRRNAYPTDLTRRYLAVLASELSTGPQTVFLPDHLRGQFVVSKGEQGLIRLAVPLVWCVGFGLSAGAAFQLVTLWGIGASSGFLGTLVAFSALGLISGLAASQNLLSRSFLWIGFGLALEIIGGMIQPQGSSVMQTVTTGLLLAMFFGLMGELAVRLLGRELPLVGSVSFSWAAARHYAPRTFVIGAAFGLAYNVPNWIANGWPITRAVLVGVFFGLILGLFVGISMGFGRGVQVAPIPVRIHPNAELRASTRIGMTVGLITAVVVGGVFFLSGLVGGVELAIVRAITWGPAAGLLWGLATGLGAVLQYWGSRIALWRDGRLPLRLIRWLEYAVHLRVLYRAGGGYVFIHRTLQDALSGVQPTGRQPHHPVSEGRP